MSYVLVKYENNWADEFDLFGMLITTREEWENSVDRAKKVFSNDDIVEVYFGTNESVEYSDLDDYLSHFSVDELSYKDYQVLVSILGSFALGHFLTVE